MLTGGRTGAAGAGATFIASRMARRIAIWTQGGDEFARVTSQDTVMGVDGKEHVSDQATIWRWRKAFQNDFAARMGWTISDFAHAGHESAGSGEWTGGDRAVEMDVTVGQTVTLDANGSTDPDGRGLHYHWFHYAEAGHCGWQSGGLDADRRGNSAGHGQGGCGMPSAVAAGMMPCRVQARRMLFWR